MQRYSAIALCVTASIGALIAAQPAAAQAAADTATGNELGDIVVTARRTNENLQSVPVAVSVLSGDALEKQRITSGRDLQYSVPSLVVAADPLGGTTAPVFQLRGQTPPLGSDDTVVTYLGDVPVNSRAFSGGLFDLQSVQVIRGPQGTLFGKNSTGGAVIFTPRKADTEKVSGFLDGTIGNYSLYQVGAGVNVPLIQGKLGVRFSGQITRQNGFVRNLSGPDGADKHYEVFRASVVATPTDDLRNETYFNYFHGRQHQNPQIFTGFNNATIGQIPVLGPQVLSEFQHQQQLGPRTIDYSFGANNDDNDVYIVTNTTSYTFGNDIVLKNIFGYYNQKPRVRLGQTSTNTPLIDVIQNKNQNEISEELQLSGQSGGLKWIMGGFYSRENTSTYQKAWQFGALAVQNTSIDHYSSKALFAQGTYDFSSMGLNGVKFTAGLRHSWDSRTGDLSSDRFDASQNLIPQPPVSTSRKDQAWSWTLGLDYQVNNDVLLYVASRHSYKAGGLNLVSNSVPAVLLTYNPEKLTDLEIGTKSTFRVGEAQIRTNIAAYTGWYSDVQTQELAACPPDVGSFIVNAAKGRPKGLEFEVDASLTRNLRVGGFYNRTLGKYPEFALVQANGCFVIGGSADLNNTDFPQINKDTAGLNAAYTIPLKGQGEELVVSGNLYYRSSKLGNATSGTNAGYPGYTLLNARLDYTNIGGTNFSAGFWVRNITDKLYVAHRNDSTPLSGYDVYAYGDPRTFGLDLKYHF